MYTKLKLKNKIVRFWKLLGPGLVTGASDDDPSGIATYSQAPAYGFDSTNVCQNWVGHFPWINRSA